jgi:hypothetical protein
MPERSKGRVQTKRDTLVLPGWGLGMRLTSSSCKKNFEKPNNQPQISETYGKRTKHRTRNSDIVMATWNMRWLDDVENDLKKMKVKGWKETMNREQWRLVVVEAKVCPGL